MSIKERLNLLRASQKKRTGPPEIPYIQKKHILPYLSIALLLVAGYLVFVLFRQYVWPAFLALLLYIGFYRFNNALSIFFSQGKQSPSAKTWAAAISTLLAFILIVLPSIMLIKQLVSEGYWLVGSLHDLFSNEKIWDNLEKIPILPSLITTNSFFWVELLNTVNDLSKELNNYLRPEQIGEWMENLFRLLGGGVSFTLSFLYNLLLITALLFFLFRDGPAFYKVLRQALPFPMDLTDHFTNQMQNTITDVLKGSILISIIQGFAVSLGLLVCGFESIVSYGAIAAIFSVIPVIGTAVVWLPSALYLAAAEGRHLAAILLGVYGLGMYSILENVLKPKLLVSKLGIHPLFLFFSILGGITEFGITGTIIGPLFLVLFKTIWNIYHIWEPRNTDSDSNAVEEKIPAEPEAESDETESKPEI